MQKNIFGKGETRQIDRALENILINKKNPGSRTVRKQPLITFPDREYFFILRKMYHTFMFDMKEFAIDFLGISIEKYIQSLLYLTYVQSHIYKLDLSIEKRASHLSRYLNVDFRIVKDDLKIFLKEHNLLDAEINRCVNSVMHYLAFEYRQIHQNHSLATNQIFRILEWKSADLEILRRIILKMGDIKIRKKEMEFFRLLDKIREIFDDIRDYDEDQTLKNFNTLLFLKRNYASPDYPFKILKEYINKECTRCLQMAQQMESNKHRKFQAIGERLKQEKKFYLAELHHIAGSG